MGSSRNSARPSTVEPPCRFHSLPRKLRDIELNMSPDGGAWTLEEDSTGGSAPVHDPFQKLSSLTYFQNNTSNGATHRNLYRSYRRRSASGGTLHKSSSVEGSKSRSPSSSKGLSASFQDILLHDLSKDRSGLATPVLEMRLRIGTFGSSTKPGKRKLFGKKNFPDDTHGLFDAISSSSLGLVQDILTKNTIDLNSISWKGFSPLEVAVLLGHNEIAALLMDHNAQETFTLESQGRLMDHIEKAIGLSILEVQTLTKSISVNHQDIKSVERKLRDLGWNVHLLRAMELGYSKLEVPSITIQLEAYASSETSINVAIPPPSSNRETLITKYIVEWSNDGEFSTVLGSKVVTDLSCKFITIDRLQNDCFYYFRAACGNLKGYGHFSPTKPQVVSPTAWHSLEVGYEDQHQSLRLITELLDKYHADRSSWRVSVESTESFDRTLLDWNASKSLFGRSITKKAFSIFGTTPRLMSRSKGKGVYFGTLFYNEEGKVMVTNEDMILLSEVDEHYNQKSLFSEYLWLLKVSSDWDQAGILYLDTKSSSTSCSVQFKRSLLHTVQTIQELCGQRNLGQLFYQPIKDQSGTFIFLSINRIKKADILNSRLSNFKWISPNKVMYKFVPPFNIAKTLLPYHRCCQGRLKRGLYLGYLKVYNSLDSVQVMVPASLPNVLPCVKLRDNPNVTRSEWHWLKTGKCSDYGEVVQFREQVEKGVASLFSLLDIDISEVHSHYLYHSTVVQMSSDISYLIIFPRCTRDVSTLPISGHGSREGHLLIPAQVFEFVNMSSYRQEYMLQYSQLSALLELDDIVAQQLNRASISAEDAAVARQRSRMVEETQKVLEKFWKKGRWLINLLHSSHMMTDENSLTVRSLLMLPPPSDGTVASSPSMGPRSASLKVRVTSEVTRTRVLAFKVEAEESTTCAEVVEALLEPMYTAEPAAPVYRVSDLYLLAVVDDREHPIPDAFSPTLLQLPLFFGKLYLRLKEPYYNRNK